MKKNTLLIFGMLFIAIPWAKAQTNTNYGTQAGFNTGSGLYNSFFGYRSGYNNTSGSYNTFVGFQAGLNSTIGRDNVFLGQGAGQYNVSGSYNVYIGGSTGAYATGSNNTFVGQSAGAFNTGSGNVFLGRSAGENATGSNKLYISNNSAMPLIYGEFDNRKVGINTITPNATLDVAGAIQISSANIPMGLIPEVGGTTPVLNLSLNLRESNKNNSYLGAAFRIDSRLDQPVFQWFYRSAGSPVEQVIMSTTREGNLNVTGNVQVGANLFTDAIYASASGKIQIGYNPSPSTQAQMPGVTVERFECLNCIYNSNDANLKRVLINTNKGVNGTAMSVAGAVHIRDRNAASGTININKLDQYLLWVEKGIVSNDYAIAGPDKWADYVFKSGYELKDLKTVEEFILTNGHLPNIPSESEIKKEGYSIHEMNTKLLEKIEELTLHTIDQQKKIDELFLLLKEQPAKNSKP